MSITAKVIAINRLRMGIDGVGVTTLVGLHQCQLNCKYCINKDGYTQEPKIYTVEELYNRVVKDDLYFSYTGGGICFGGHEPLLQSEFIKEFISYVKQRNHDWYFTMETSLNSIFDEDLLNYIDLFIIDVKDMNPQIYEKYTGKNNKLVIENLMKVRCANLKLRLPLMSNYNTSNDIESSKNILLGMGFNSNQFDVFEYIIKE